VLVCRVLEWLRSFSLMRWFELTGGKVRTAVATAPSSDSYWAVRSHKRHVHILLFALLYPPKKQLHVLLNVRVISPGAAVLPDTRAVLR